MTTSHPPPLTYAIDRDDRLIDVDLNWESFAEENEARGRLRPEAVIGKPLWEFIRGDSLQTIYKDLLVHIRQRNQPIEFDYRCDSPNLRRFMRMEMVANNEGCVRFVSRTVQVVPREHVVRVVAADRGHHQIRCCSMCNYFRLSDGSWTDAASAVTEGRVLDQERPLRVLWAVCKTCMDKFYQSA